MNRDTALPEYIYASRQAVHNTKKNKLNVMDSRMSLARAFIGLIALFMAWLIWIDKTLAPVWLLVLTGVFLIIVAVHAKVTKRLKRIQRAINYYQQGLDRIAGLWSGQGNAGTRYSNPDHPYSADLDIFGQGSLFELICSARTRLGEDMLATWFLAAADLKTVEQRQQAVNEFREQIEFREQLALQEAVSNSELDQKKLSIWAQARAQPVGYWQRTMAIVLAVMAMLSGIAWLAGYGFLPLLAVIILEIIFYATNYKQIQHIAAQANTAASGIIILTQVLELIEKNDYKTPLLQQLRAKLKTDGHAPSWQINRLNKLTLLLNNCLQNQFIMPVAFILGIPLHTAHCIEQWRERIAPHISHWFDTIGQFEAISSLATYAFENPDDSFPELVPGLEGSCFNATELGHPLLAKNNCVRNDIRIDSELRLIMISGSNMSGKSTLLRTVGINVVLALCGAPVRAKNMKTSRFAIGSAMRANDSLQQGASLFYAVIARIAAVVKLSNQSVPVLFLLDEILQGTNSHDRFIGAKAIINQLLAKSAVGLVTTHDLALNAIADSLGSQATNIHFEDQLVNGRMHFDYKIRLGVIEKSNALALMRMIGLHIDEELTDKTVRS